MNAGDYTARAAALYLAAIHRADVRARRERLSDFRAAMCDEKVFAAHYKNLKA